MLDATKPPHQGPHVPPQTPTHTTSRRAWLGALGASLTAGPAATPRERAPREDLADAKAAQRLAGLTFSEADLERAAPRLRAQRAAYDDLRAYRLDRFTDPAFQFDPWPAGAVRPPLEAPAPFAPPAVANADPVDADLAFASIAELQALLRAGRLTSRRLTELALARLLDLDQQLHCVVTLLREHALGAADRADAELRAGRVRGPLHGIPFGAKDLFAHPAGPTTFGAAPFRTQHLPMRATVLARLEDAGAVLVAKLSLGALAMGDRWFGGTTRNPWNPEQGSSGSSAGSAAATAAGLVPFALGTETLGSIVSPAVRCSVTGLRPTFGAIPRTGAMALSWTMDKVGVLARSALDCALVFDVLRGPDDVDLSTRRAGFGFTASGDLRGMRVGVLAGQRQPPDAGFVAFLRDHGVELGDVAWPDLPYAAMRTILEVEAATAFDELTREGGVDQLADQSARAWPSLFRAARFVPAVEYVRAQRVRRDLVQAMAATMAGFDAVLAPTHTGATLLCSNLSGHPTVVFPVADGPRQPSSASLIGGLFGEASLLRIVHAWQRESEFHRRRPPRTR
ncbi:MAG: amidase [Planctomycetota bacterium]